MESGGLTRDQEDYMDTILGGDSVFVGVICLLEIPRRLPVLGENAFWFSSITANMIITVFLFYQHFLVRI